MSVNSSFEYSATARAITFSKADPFAIFVAGFNATNEGLLLDISGPNAQVTRSFSTASNSAYSLAVSPDNMKLALGANDNKIHLYNVSTGQEFATKSAHTGIVNSLAWSSDGLTFASAGADGKLILWGDRTPPTIKITADRQVVNFANRRVNVSLEFNESMDTSVAPLVTGGPLPNRTGETFLGAWIRPKVWNGSTIFPVIIMDGPNGIRASGARDISGNLMANADSTFTITVDTVRARCVVDPLPPFTNSTSIPLVSNASDWSPGTGVDTVWFHARDLNGSWFQFDADNSSPYSSTFTAAGDGTYYFASTCLDRAGNPTPWINATGQANTTVDTIPPSTRVAPIAKNIAQWNFTADANANDTGSGTQAVELWYNKEGGGWTFYGSDSSFPYKWLFDARPLGQGCYEFTSRGRDLAGNREPAHPQNDTWACVDLGLPETEMTPLAPATKNRAIFLETAITRPADGVSSVSFDVDDGTGWRSFQNTSLTTAVFNAPADSCYGFRTIARTFLGKQEPEPLGNDTYTCVDSVPPKVIDTFPRNGSLAVPADVSLKLTFSEPVAQPSLKVLVNSQALAASASWTSGDRIVSLKPAADLPKGVNILVVSTFEDPAGNQGTHIFEFTTSGVTPGKGNLRVQVRDLDGNAVPDAEVVVTMLGSSPRQKTADAAGIALFTDLEPGTYEVAARKSGYIEGKVNFGIVAGKETIINVTLTPEGAPPPPILSATALALLVVLVVIALLVGILIARRGRTPLKEEHISEKAKPVPGKAKRAKSEAAAPTLKVSSSKTPGSVKLEWESFPNDEGYVIYHKATEAGAEPPKSGDLEKLISLPKGSASYVHEGLDPGSEHWYSLAISYGTGGESPRSKPVGALVAPTK